MKLKSAAVALLTCVGGVMATAASIATPPTTAPTEAPRFFAASQSDAPAARPAQVATPPATREGMMICKGLNTYTVTFTYPADWKMVTNGDTVIAHVATSRATAAYWGGRIVVWRNKKSFQETQAETVAGINAQPGTHILDVSAVKIPGGIDAGVTTFTMPSVKGERTVRYRLTPLTDLESLQIIEDSYSEGWPEMSKLLSTITSSAKVKPLKEPQPSTP